MPIYTYRCAQCGHTEDFLQKVSAIPLTHCPACHQDTFEKQLTAAAFQLKGSGYYVTDFRQAGSDSGNTLSDLSSKQAQKSQAPVSEQAAKGQGGNESTNTSPSATPNTKTSSTSSVPLPASS